MGAAKVIAFRPAALTWDDIQRMRDTSDRPASFFRRIQPIACELVGDDDAGEVTRIAAPTDPRSLSNVRPHTDQPSYSGPKLTPARAATNRRKQLAACGCRRCALALNPPQTFADAERFAYAVDTSAVFGGAFGALVRFDGKDW